MKILVTGATGLIGAAVVARLAREGHQLVRVVRNGAGHDDDVVVRDFADATVPADWMAPLQGVDAVVNCAGVLQDSPRDSTRAVHVDGLAALIAACEQLGVQRFIHMSAIGTERDPLSEFSSTKRAGEALLFGSALDWIVLRPSVVVGRAAYGGSAMFRGLAALPLLPQLPDVGLLQIVQLDDVTETVVRVLQGPARLTLDLAGPESLTMVEVIRAYRRWLGWRPARIVSVPPVAAAVLYWIGDMIAWLGWRSPVRSTARHELTRGAVGDNSEWMQLTGITPQALGAALAAEPASVQERWFARLYFVKPFAFVMFPVFWIVTGLISVGPGYETGRALMLEAGAGQLAGFAVAAGALADIVIGVAIAFRRTARIGLYAALAVSVCYFFAGGILVPRLWIDPLGPLLKIWPIIGVNLAMLAMLPER